MKLLLPRSLIGRCLCLSLFLHLSILVLSRGFFSATELPLAGSGGVDVQIQGPSLTETDIGNRKIASASRQEHQNRLSAMQGPGTGVGTEGSGSGMEGTDPVLAAIRSRIEKAKSYPLLAERMGVEGVVEIQFEILEDGSPTAITLLQSSGSKLLDDAARSSIEKGSPYPFYQKPVSLSLHYRKGTS